MLINDTGNRKDQGKFNANYKEEALLLAMFTPNRVKEPARLVKLSLEMGARW